MNCVIHIANPQKTPICPPKKVTKHLRKQKAREEARALRSQGFYNDPANGTWTRSPSGKLSDATKKNVFEGEFRTNKAKRSKGRTRRTQDE